MADVTPISGQHGGSRPGAGRRSAADSRNEVYDIINKAKAKRETFKAKLLELEFKQKDGELIPVADVQAAWLDHVAIAKGRFLALPARLAPELLGLATLREIEARLRDALIEVLDEMAHASGD